MKKLNNRGFAVSTILYGILSLIILILMIIFGVMKASKDMNEDLVESLTNSMNACVSVEAKLESCYFSGATDCTSFLTQYEECNEYGGIVDRTLRGQILLDNEVYADNVSSKYVSMSTGIDFSLPSSETNGRGLYYTSTNTENGGTTYYFRGAVENNYVQFGKHQTDNFEYRGYYSDTSSSFQTYESLEACNSSSSFNYNCGEYGWHNGDEIIWRIVRINEDGSIRLAYHGTLSNSTIVIGKGYYGSDIYWGNYGSSFVKTAVDNWYTAHLSDKYSTMLADPGFCNDTIVYDDSSTTYYQGYNRLKNENQPQFKCYSKTRLFTLSGNTIGNGNLTHPIGIITADELVYAGMSVKTKNQDCYLLTNSFWTMTKYSDSGVVNMFAYIHGSIPWYNGSENSTILGFRPVININSDALVTSAISDGTIEKPYIIAMSN